MKRPALLFLAASAAALSIHCSSDDLLNQTLSAPTTAAIRAAVAANNAYGIVPGLTLGEITIPACAEEDGTTPDFTVTYAMSDLAVANFGIDGIGTTISVFVGDGDGAFSSPSYYDTNVEDGRPFGIVAGDFDNDGDIDIAACNSANPEGGYTTILLNQ